MSTESGGLGRSVSWAALVALSSAMGCGDMPAPATIGGANGGAGHGGTMGTSGSGGGGAGVAVGGSGGASSSGSGGGTDAGADAVSPSASDGAAGGSSDAFVAPANLPKGPSDGCHITPAATDKPGTWVLHPIAVNGVDAQFLMGGKEFGSQGGYDFSHRNYFLKLPKNYDNTRAYPLVMSGGGCGATNGTSGNGGGQNALPDDQDFAVQVGLSYVYSNGAGACFTDQYTDTPDLPYFDAVVAEVEKNTCVDKGKVFMSGFSSGAWETYMLAC